jgi:hypothetical protein
MLLPWLELDKKQGEIKLRISRAMYKCLRLELIAITPRTEKEVVRPCDILFGRIFTGFGGIDSILTLFNFFIRSIPLDSKHFI